MGQSKFEPLPRDIQTRQDQMRGAAKWLVGAAAGVGAFMLSGLGLSDLEAQEVSSGRLAVAVGAYLLGIATVGVVLHAAAMVLSSPFLTLADLAERETIALTRATRDAGTTVLHEPDPSAFDPILGAIDQHRRALCQREFDSIQDLYARVGVSGDPVLESDASRVCAFATYKLMEQRFAALIRRLLAGGVVVAIATVSVLWVLRAADVSPPIEDPLPVEVVLEDVEADRGALGLGPDCSASTLEGVAIAGTTTTPHVVTKPTSGCEGASFLVTEDIGIAIPMSES